MEDRIPDLSDDVKNQECTPVRWRKALFGQPRTLPYSPITAWPRLEEGGAVCSPVQKLLHSAETRESPFIRHRFLLQYWSIKAVKTGNIAQPCAKNQEELLLTKHQWSPETPQRCHIAGQQDRAGEGTQSLFLVSSLPLPWSPGFVDLSKERKFSPLQNGSQRYLVKWWALVHLLESFTYSKTIPSNEIWLGHKVSKRKNLEILMEIRNSAAGYISVCLVHYVCLGKIRLRTAESTELNSIPQRKTR